MKVVLFCGGLGMRMRADNQSLPKPMMPIGNRPVLWHVMRYYAHFGHTEFILCLGYGAAGGQGLLPPLRRDASNDFVLTKGGSIELLSTDISDWTITFIDTGIDTTIGERLRRVRPLPRGRRVLPGQLRRRAHRRAAGRPWSTSSRETDAVGQFLAVTPQDSFHVVESTRTAR